MGFPRATPGVGADGEGDCAGKVADADEGVVVWQVVGDVGGGVEGW